MHNSNVKVVVICFFLLLLSVLNSFSVVIETHFIPPHENYSKSLQHTKEIEGVSLYSLINQPFPVYTYSKMADKKLLLREESKYGKALRVAVREELNIESRVVFSDSLLKQRGKDYFVGALIIEGAEGIRLAVDFSDFQVGDSLWLYVPDNDILLGPFPEKGTKKPINEYWLPTIEGDNVILILQSANQKLP